MRINFCTTQHAKFWQLFAQERDAMRGTRASSRA